MGSDHSADKPAESLTNKIFRYGNELVYICLLSVLWLLCSLPLVTMGAATAGVFACLLAHVKDGDRHYVRPFWMAFRRSFTTVALPSTLVFLVMGLATFNVYYYLAHRGGLWGWVLAGVQGLLVIVGVVWMTYWLSAVGRFAEQGEAGQPPRFSVGLRLITARPGWSAALAAVSLGLPALLVVTQLWQFSIVAVGLICYANTRLLLRSGSL